MRKTFHFRKEEAMEYLIMLVIGMIVGGGIMYFTLLNEFKPSGTFVIDLSDPMKDVCRMEMDESLDSIYSKKQIVLNVNTFAEFSQD